MSNAHRLVAGMTTIAFGFILAGCSGSAAGGGGDVAEVDGQKITRAEFDAKLEGGPAGKQTLSQLIQGVLVEQYGKNNNITVTDADVKKKVDEIKARYPPEQFDQILKQQGLTMDDVNRLLRQQLIIEKAVGKNVVISDADIKAYFEKNRTAYDKPEQVRARHILVADEKTADTIYDKLKAGAKFEDLAKQYSTDPSTKDKGGELGFFGRHQMVPAFESAAFSQPINEIGKPVKSPFGWHVIQVEERKAPQKATLAAVHDQIKAQLVQQQDAQQVPLFLEGLKSKAHIVIYDERLKDAIPSPPPAAPAAVTPSAAPAAGASAATAPPAAAATAAASAAPAKAAPAAASASPAAKAK